MKRLLNILAKRLDVKPGKHLQNIFFKRFAENVLNTKPFQNVLETSCVCWVVTADYELCVERSELGHLFYG